MGKAQKTNLDDLYPTVSRFVREQGWIEIGDHEGEGQVVRALDYGGLVFESRKPRTLTQAMAMLEKDLADRLESQ